MLGVSTTLVAPGDEAMVTDVAAEIAHVVAIAPVNLQAERATEPAEWRNTRDECVSRKRTKRRERRQ